MTYLSTYRRSLKRFWQNRSSIKVNSRYWSNKMSCWPPKSYFVSWVIQWAWLGASITRDAINLANWAVKSQFEPWWMSALPIFGKSDAKSTEVAWGKSCHHIVLVTLFHYITMKIDQQFCHVNDIQTLNHIIVVNLL